MSCGYNTGCAYTTQPMKITTNSDYYTAAQHYGDIVVLSNNTYRSYSYNIVIICHPVDRRNKSITDTKTRGSWETGESSR